MALVICPECKRKISQYAKSCPTCAFPINEFMTEHKQLDTNKKFVCPTCAFTSAGYGDESDPIYLKCKYCNTIMIQTDETGEEFISNFITYKDEDYHKTLALKYGNGEFSEEKYQQKLNIIRKENNPAPQPFAQSTPQVTCPYCHSTNTKKITAGSRVKSTLMFGIFSKKNGKEWHCESCDSDF